MNFLSGASLTVYGTLNVNGTSSSQVTFNFTSPNSSTQNGIKFNSGSGGTLSYCNIQNAYRGIGCWNNMPEIKNCTITGNTIGIYLNGITSSTSKSVEYNTINNNSYYGISLYNSYGWIYDNQIRNNGSCGIYCYYYSSPMLTDNIITGSTCGISASNYCSPLIGQNVIESNAYGVTAGYCNNIYMGAYHYLGYNSIFGNTSYSIDAQYAGTIYAEYNWWGNPPDQYYLINSTLDNSNALTYDPNSGRSSAVQLSKSLSKAVRVTNLTSYVKNLSIDTTNSELAEAMQFEMQKDYNNAITKYSGILSHEFTSNVGISALIGMWECYALSGKKGFDNYLQNKMLGMNKTKNEFTVVMLEMLNHSLIEKGSYTDAVQNMKIIKDSLTMNQDIEKENLFNLGYVYQNYLDDKTEASVYLNKLISKYPNDLITQQATLLLVEGVILNSESKQIAKSLSTSRVENYPSNFTLYQNYPNPFNPSTLIEYQIPRKEYVILKIFDLLGREVTTLVNSYKDKGRYSVTFDGSSLASGIYFYQLKAGVNIAIKKMLFVK